MRRLSARALQLFGVHIPESVQIGDRFALCHGGVGTVIHPRTVIGDHVMIYHNVTIGRKDGHIPFERSQMTSVVIGDHAMLFPGSVILAGPGRTTIGEGAVVGANSVVLRSVPAWEIWAGNPARKVGDRDRAEPRRL